VQEQALCQSKMAPSTAIMTPLLVASSLCISFFTRQKANISGCTFSLVQPWMFACYLLKRNRNTGMVTDKCVAAIMLLVAVEALLQHLLLQ